jgi:curved DNA-binding protein CbpA
VIAVAKSNFYQQLAVPMGAEPAEILFAYRRIMLTVDPNVGARSDPEQYRDTQDAYLVLSNPDRRRAHDIELSTGRRTFATEAPRWKPPVTIPGDFTSMTPSPEELLDHISQNFHGYRRKSDGPFRRLGLDAILQREDTRFGCHLPVSLFTSRSQVLFEIPRDTQDGEIFEMDLSKIGIHNLTLQLRVVVV